MNRKEPNFTLGGLPISAAQAAERWADNVLKDGKIPDHDARVGLAQGIKQLEAQVRAQVERNTENIRRIQEDEHTIQRLRLSCSADRRRSRRHRRWNRILRDS